MERHKEWQQKLADTQIQLPIILGICVLKKSAVFLSFCIHGRKAGQNLNS